MIHADYVVVMREQCAWATQTGRQCARAATPRDEVGTPSIPLCDQHWESLLTWQRWWPVTQEQAAIDKAFGVLTLRRAEHVERVDAERRKAEAFRAVAERVTHLVAASDIGASWVYLIELGEPQGIIKIGVSTNPRQRLAQHSREHGPIRLLALIPGDQKREAEIHRQWQECRDSSSREWFRPTPRLLAFIDQLPKAA